MLLPEYVNTKPKNLPKLKAVSSSPARSVFLSYSMIQEGLPLVGRLLCVSSGRWVLLFHQNHFLWLYKAMLAIRLSVQIQHLLFWLWLWPEVCLEPGKAWVFSFYRYVNLTALVYRWVKNTFNHHQINVLKKGIQLPQSEVVLTRIFNLFQNKSQTQNPLSTIWKKKRRNFKSIFHFTLHYFIVHAVYIEGVQFSAILASYCWPNHTGWNSQVQNFRKKSNSISQYIE